MTANVIVSARNVTTVIIIPLPLYNPRSIETFMKLSLHNTIAKYINMYSIFVTLITLRELSLYMLLLIVLTFDTPTKQEKMYLKPCCTPFPGNMSFNLETVAKRWVWAWTCPRFQTHRLPFPSKATPLVERIVRWPREIDALQLRKIHANRKSPSKVKVQ